MEDRYKQFHKSFKKDDQACTKEYKKLQNRKKWIIFKGTIKYLYLLIKINPLYLLDINLVKHYKKCIEIYLKCHYL